MKTIALDILNRKTPLCNDLALVALNPNRRKEAHGYNNTVFSHENEFQREFDTPIRCATIGSQPTRHDNWLRLGLNEYTHQGSYKPESKVSGNEIEQELAQLRSANVSLQTEAKMNLISEGEIFRSSKEFSGSSYIMYIAQFIDGIRRTGNRNEPLSIDGPLKNIDWRVICDDWIKAQQLTSFPVKINLPGPITFASRMPGSHYKSREKLASDYAQILGVQLRALESLGCKWVQIDDPHLTVKPGVHYYAQTTSGFDLYRYGVDCLNEALAFTNGSINTVVHMCQGNPYNFLNDAAKTQQQIYYRKIAPLLAASRVDAVAIEKPNVSGLEEFGLEEFGDKTIFMGLVDVVDPTVESVSNIADDIVTALKEVPADRLVITPDCGIKHFPEQLAISKLQNMSKAVHLINKAFHEMAMKN